MSQNLYPNCKILVVDDETDLEYLIQLKFRRQILDKSYQFEFACDGSDALSKITEIPGISIVLTDINMPKMDGQTFIRLLRNKQETADIPVVITSSIADGAIEADMNKLGIKSIIKKPVSPEKILHVLEAI